MISEEDSVNTCDDCGCNEGQIHDRGCDMEICPFCGGELASCPCFEANFGSEMPAYNECDEMLDRHLERWDTILDTKGRVPYIHYPTVCEYCGFIWLDPFTVWKGGGPKDIKRIRGHVPCWDCRFKTEQLINDS